MKISITTTNFQKDFVLPSNAYFVGITLIYENMNIDIIKIKNHSCEKQEEIILNENAKIILYYYDSLKAKEIFEAFDEYENIKCIEVHNPSLDLIVSI